VAKEPASSSEENPVPPKQDAEAAASEVVDADKTDETTTAPTETEAAAAANGDGPKPEDATKDPAPQPGTDGDSPAVGEGSPAAHDDMGKLGGTPKPVLRLDHIREISTASTMSSSAPDTPGEDAASSAVDLEDDGGAPGSAVTQNKKRRRPKKKKMKGEKNSPRPPSGATVNDVDNSIAQDPKPVAAAPVDVHIPVPIPSGEGEGELVEKVDSSGDDGAVLVEKPPQVEAKKAADGTGSDEWEEFQDPTD
jgi:hypothetical protein